MGRWIRTAGLAALGAVALGGCALELTPAGTGTATVTTGGGIPAVTDNEVATPPGPEEQARSVAAPEVAVRDFAEGYINWDAADVRARLSALARASVGQARSAMQLAASQTGADPELAQVGIANHGTVEAVARLGGAAERYVVVTLESTTATNSSAYEGLAPAWHLTVATVTRRDGGWVISGWQPES